MHTIINPASSNGRKAPARTFNHAYREPKYDCIEQRDGLKLVVYLPGVDASGVEIEARAGDLTVTARKPRVVRVNWQALHLEGAQRDYRLRLRLGSGFDFSAMEAEIGNAVLTVTLPKLRAETSGRLHAAT
jgi:HSP20 family protein